MAKFQKAPAPPPHPVFANPRITARDRGLIKGALRRAFSRSELRESVMAAARVEHSDPDRPRCRRWIRCQACGQPAPEWSSAVDHAEPVVPLESSFEQMGVDATVAAMWCNLSNLQAICQACHDAKTQLERVAREDYEILHGWRAPRKPKKARGK